MIIMVIILGIIMEFFVGIIIYIDKRNIFKYIIKYNENYRFI